MRAQLPQPLRTQTGMDAPLRKTVYIGSNPEQPGSLPGDCPDAPDELLSLPIGLSASAGYQAGVGVRDQCRLSRGTRSRHKDSSPA